MFLPGLVLAFFPVVFPFYAAGQQTSAQDAGKDRSAPDHSLEALLDGSGFVRIPAGEFTMGSNSGNDDERPPHRVRISQPFEMSKYEVTQAQWNAVMGAAHAGPSAADPESGVNPSHYRGPSLPVESVDWNTVHLFLDKLNGRDKAHTYRLPTEAEWEYAARAASENESRTERTDSSWCAENSNDRTHPAGEKPPNAWGLYDMIGNVQEWVQDWYAPDSYSAGDATDPQGPASGSYRVYRGGAWLTAAKNCRPAFRAFDLPANAQSSVGFRLVRSPK